MIYTPFLYIENCKILCMFELKQFIGKLIKIRSENNCLLMKQCRY